MGFNDNGYLAFRFFINPKGKTILHEIHEMNFDLQNINLNDSLVSSLKKIKL